MNALVELEAKALHLKNSGSSEEAAEMFAAIVEQRPDWEHGQAFHDLAQCYEDSGQLDAAAEAYRRALEFQPSNQIFLGGYASFLYLHGDAADAFDWHMRLLHSYRVQGSEEDAASCILALRALGEKLGRNPDAINERLQER